MKHPPLLLSPQVFSNLRYLCTKAPVELAVFGIAGDPKQPLTLTNFFVPTQKATSCTCEPTEQGLAAMMDHCEKESLDPIQLFPYWIHFHNNGVAGLHNPSSTDWATFDELHAKKPFGIMGIMSSDGWMSAWLCAPFGPCWESIAPRDRCIEIGMAIAQPEPSVAALDSILETCIVKPTPAIVPSPSSSPRTVGWDNVDEDGAWILKDNVWRFVSFSGLSKKNRRRLIAQSNRDALAAQPRRNSDPPTFPDNGWDAALADQQLLDDLEEEIERENALDADASYLR